MQTCETNTMRTTTHGRITRSPFADGVMAAWGRLTGMLVILGCLLLSACSSDDESVPADAGVSEPPTLSATITSAPDTARLATATIGALGGRVATVAADGTRYELFIPPGAVSGETRISMAPTSVTGLEAVSSSTRYAVEFAPSGLEFSTPATLIITPPAGTTVAPDDFAFSWEDGASEVDIRSVHVSNNGSLRIDVPHFSGVGTLKARFESYNKMLTLALLSLPSMNDDASILGRHVGGLPDTTQAVIDDMLRIYNTHVLPKINRSDEGVVQMQIAFKYLMAFQSIYAYLPIADIEIPGDSAARTLGGLAEEAQNLLLDKARQMSITYLPESCSASVIDLLDWIVVPIVISELRSIYGSEEQLTDYCIYTVVDDTLGSFPNAIDQDQQYIDVRYRGAVSAPLQTPGGEVIGDRKIFPQPTQFNFTKVEGAVFSGGGTDLSQLVGSDGIFVRLDRGSDAAARVPRVGLKGTAQIGAFWLEVQQALLSTRDEFLPIDESAGPPSSVNVRFEPSTVNAILEPGGATELCALIFDTENLRLAGVTVNWSLDGPGNLSQPSSVSNDTGLACVEYRHPSGVVARDTLADLTATANVDSNEGHDEIALTPRWAALGLEVRAETDSAFRPATNARIPVLEGRRMVLRASLVGQGQELADTEMPIALDQVRIQIESGGGTLITPLGASGTDLALTTDASGLVELTWDPSGTTEGATLRVSYPLNGAGIAATVALTFGGGPNMVRVTGAAVNASYNVQGTPPNQLPHTVSADEQTVDLLSSGLALGQASIFTQGSVNFDDPFSSAGRVTNYDLRSDASMDLSGATASPGQISGLSAGILRINPRCTLDSPTQMVNGSPIIIRANVVSSVGSEAGISFSVPEGRYLFSGTVSGSAPANSGVTIFVKGETSPDADGSSVLAELRLAGNIAQPTPFAAEIVGNGSITISGSAICSTNPLAALVLQSEANAFVNFSLSRIE